MASTLLGHCGYRHAAFLTLWALSVSNVAGAPKHPAKTNAPPVDGSAGASTLPADPNLASLRVSATMALYELDASAGQLRVIRAAAIGAASNRPRAAAKGAAKLMGPLNVLQNAVLSGADDGKIADLRNALVEAAGDDDVELDDPVRPTNAAFAKSNTVTRVFHASQLAAYLAVHADEVGDPVERMLSALSEAKDADASEAFHEPATEVAGLVAGDDAGKAKPIADKVEAWLKAHAGLDEAAVAKEHAALETSAQKVIGDVSPVDVLGHWLDHEMATLLSNPQLPDAIDALLASTRISG